MDKSKVEKQTLVEEGTELKGTLKSTCQVVVNGTIEGQIEAPALTVTGTGTVLGSVKAQRLRSEGTLAGDIDAEDVYLAGSVRSNTMIRARKLEVKLAPERGKLEVTFGECLIEVGDDPAHVEEPAAEPAHVAPVEQNRTMGAKEDVVAASRKPQDEPTWSEPPPGQVAEEVQRTKAEEPSSDQFALTAASSEQEQAEAVARPAGETSESNGSSRRRSKNPERRDSQAPPS